VVFVMNHRSNMDYVLVTWLAGEHSALAYAVGEWARVWPLRQLVQALGGYFIRRRHNNPLYRKVLARYVQMATEAGVTQAVFPEGGLSRTGELRPPKLGLLSYIMDGFTPGRSRDVVFVPVALNYDRVMEDRNLIRAHASNSSRFRFSLRPIWRYLRRQIWLRITGRFHRYGYAAVSFGEPLSLTAFLTGGPASTPEDLGGTLMTRISAVMPVVPVPLVCHALAAGAATRSDLTAEVARRIAFGKARGAVVHVPRGDMGYLVEVGIRALTERGMLQLQEDTLVLTPEGSEIVGFYARSVDMVFADLPTESTT